MSVPAVCVLTTLGVPLSSDALCRFGHHDRHVHNPEVKVATQRLLQVVIPEYAKNLDATAGNELNIATIVTQVRTLQAEFACCAMLTLRATDAPGGH